MEKNGSFDFGMALSTIGVDSQSLQDYLDFPSLNAIELPPEVLCNPDKFPAIERKLATGKFKNVISGGLLDSSITRNIAFSDDEKFIRSYCRESLKILSILADNDIKLCSLELPMNDILSDEKACAIALKIIRQLGGVLLERDMTLCLPFRLPTNSASTSMMMKFLRDTCLPAVKLRLEIHPREYHAETPPDIRTESGLLYFETCLSVFVYDADCGGRLTKTHIKPWLDFMASHRRFHTVLSAPLSLRQRAAFPESEAFSKLAPEL